MQSSKCQFIHKPKPHANYQNLQKKNLHKITLWLQMITTCVFFGDDCVDFRPKSIWWNWENWRSFGNFL